MSKSSTRILNRRTVFAGAGAAGALAAAALFLAVFPANLNMVRLWWNKPGAAKWPMRIGALARLPLQVPMITQALAIRRNAPRRA